MPDLAHNPPTRRPTATTCACACACTCKDVSPSPSLSRCTLYSPSLSPYLTASWNSPPRFLSLRHSLPPTSLLLSFPPSLTLHFTPTTSPTNHNPRPFLSSFPFRRPRLLIAPTYNRSRRACLLSHQTHNTHHKYNPDCPFQIDPFVVLALLHQTEPLLAAFASYRPLSSTTDLEDDACEHPHAGPPLAVFLFSW